MSAQNIIFFGPPGAGKGTQAAKVIDLVKVPHISTGDMFRYNIKNNTELGQKALEYTNAGKLVPDEVTIAMVKDRLSMEDTEKGFMLDGFPRSVPQAEALDAILKEQGRSLDIVLNLAITDEEIMNRLKSRAEIEGRADDADPAIIQNRIDTYKSQSEPCLGYFKKTDGLVADIDGIGTIEEIFDRIKAVL